MPLVAVVVVALVASLLNPVPWSPAPAEAATPVDFPFPFPIDVDDLGSTANSDARPEVAVSADGRLVAYLSEDSHFATGGGDQVKAFVKDRDAGTITWVDRPLVPSSGAPTEAHHLAISADGSSVAFVHSSGPGGELLAGVTGRHVYHLHLATGVLTAVTALPLEVEPIGAGTADSTGGVAISGNGRRVAYRTTQPAHAPDLPTDLAGDKAQLVLADLDAGTTAWVEAPPGGDPPINAGDRDPFVITDDGTQVIFTSSATNLVPEAVHPGGTLLAQVYAYDVATGAVTLLSATPGGLVTSSGPARLAGWGAASGDGSRVALDVVAPVGEFVAGAIDTNGASDIVLVDRTVGTHTLISRPGVEATTCPTGVARNAAVSGDGAVVTFAQHCDGEFPDGVDHQGTDVFAFRPGQLPERRTGFQDGKPLQRPPDCGGPCPIPHDLDATGTTLVAVDAKVGDSFTKFVWAWEQQLSVPPDRRVSEDSLGQPARRNVSMPAISDDGRFVAMLTSSFDPYGGARQVPFVKDLETGFLSRVLDRRFGFAQVNHVSAIDLSGDGRWVAAAGNRSSGHRAVWMGDRVAGRDDQILQFGGGRDIADIVVTTDGSRLAFVLSSDFSSNRGPVQVYSRVPGTTDFVLDRVVGTSARHPSLSADGTRLVWTDRTPQAPGMEIHDRHTAGASAADEVYALDLTAPDTTPVLISSLDGPGGDRTDASGSGNRTASRRALSDDGTVVAFETQSSVSDFAGNAHVTDRNGSVGVDVMVADLVAGTVRTASIYGPQFGVGPGPETCPGPISGQRPSMAGDGASVIFEAECVPSFSDFEDVRGLARQHGDGFVEQVTFPDGTGTYSPDSSSDAPGEPRATPDGSIVVTETGAQLVAGDTDERFDLYVFRSGPPVVPPPTDDPRLSLTAAGTQATGDSIASDLSDDGTVAVFLSNSTDLVPGLPPDPDPAFDGPRYRPFLKHTTTGAVQMLDDCLDCFGLRDAASVAISGDGRVAAWAVGDFDSERVRIVRRVLEGPGAGQEVLFDADTFGSNLALSLSDDGGRLLVSVGGVAPASPAAAPTQFGGPGVGIYLWDVTDGWSSVSLTPDGQTPDGPSAGASISGDGTVAAFATFANDVTFCCDDPIRGEMVRLELDTGFRQGTSAVGGPGIRASTVVANMTDAVSRDGSTVVFAANTEDLLAGPLDASDNHDIWAWFGGGDELLRVSAYGDADPVSCIEEGGAGSYSPAVSADGRAVVFWTRCESRHGTTLPVPVLSIDGGPPQVVGPPGASRSATGDRRAPAIDATGANGAFDTDLGLVTADTNFSFDVYGFATGVVDPPPPTEVEQTFEFTGGPQTFVVPPGVTSITVDAHGAQGGRSASSTSGAAGPSSDGGLGGRTVTDVDVTPGEALTVMVGGAGGDGGATTTINDYQVTPAPGGFNGGGCGIGVGGVNSLEGFSFQPPAFAVEQFCQPSGGGVGAVTQVVTVASTAGGGGGASDMRRGDELEDRLVVAGGGGGAAATTMVSTTDGLRLQAAGGDGGGGGGLEGGDGVDGDGPASGAGGLGGTQDGAPPPPEGTFCGAVLAGAGNGANSGFGVNLLDLGTAGGVVARVSGPGGGGWFGGSCGSVAVVDSPPLSGSGGGGGGAGHPADAMSQTGVRAGDGQVVITYVPATDPEPGEGPDLVDDAVQTFTDLEVDVDVLANDPGPVDPATLGVVAVSDGDAEVRAGDPNPTIAYTPPPGFSGTATVVYRVATPAGVTAQATLTVEVVGFGPALLALDFELPVGASDPPFTQGSTAPLVVQATNIGSATTAGPLVTVAAEAPARLAAAGAAHPDWSCEVAGDGGHATCRLAQLVGTGVDLPPLEVEVEVTDGVVPPCDASEPQGDGCVFLRVWNGTLGDEPGAEPAPERQGFAVAAGLVRVEVTDDGPFEVGEPGTYRLAVTNPGPLPVDQPRLVLDVTTADAAFVEATSSDPAWSCAAADGSPSRIECRYDGELDAAVGDDPGRLADLTVTVTTGAGLTSGCVGQPAPCQVLDVAWTDGTNEAVLLRLVTPVVDSTVPDGTDLAVTLSGSTQVAGGLTAKFTANITNVGTAPTTGPTVLTFELPEGFTPTRAVGLGWPGRPTGWDCVVDGPARLVTCTFAGTVGVAKKPPGVSISVAVDADASLGTVQAEVATDGDVQPGNDVASLTVAVVAPGDLGDGHLGLALVGTDLIAQGQTVTLDANVSNQGTADIAGPTTVAVVVPDGLPGGQRLSVAGIGDGWGCTTTALVGARQLRCTHPDGVAAGTGGPPLALDIRALAVVPGTLVELPFTVSSRFTSDRLARQLTVTEPTRALLEVAVSPDATLFAGQELPVTVQVGNVGPGPATSATLVQVPAPAGLTVVDAGGPEWTCSTTTAQATCANSPALRSGMATEALVVVLGAPADAAPGQVSVQVTAATADRFGTVGAQASAPVEVQGATSVGLELQRDPDVATTTAEGLATYPLVVANVGEATVEGPVVVTERSASGVTLAGTGDGWTCVDGPGLLSCTHPASGGLTSTGELPPIEVDLAAPASAAGGVVRVGGTVRAADGTSGASAGGLAVPPAPPPSPFEVTIALDDASVPRGGTATAQVVVTNPGPDPVPVGTTVGVVTPVGSTEVTATGDDLDCAGHPVVAEVVACVFTAPLEPDAERLIGVTFTVGEGAADEVAVAAGEVRTSSDDPRAEALELLAGRRDAALTRPAGDQRGVVALVADAGDDQEVFDLTIGASGPPTPTVVTLDASASHRGAAPLSFVWIQTSGPPVRWIDDIDPLPVGGATTVASVSGPRPTFEAPRVQDDERTTLGFTVAVSDGEATGVATTTVTVVAAGNRPPRLTAILATPAGDGPPPAGTTVELRTEADDPDGDPVSLSWRITGGDGPLAGVTLAELGNRASLVWPAGTTFLGVAVTAEDGRGGRTTEHRTLGAAPPPLVISASGPVLPTQPGDPVALTATATGAAAGDLFWSWRQISGPTVDPAAVSGATGPTLTFPAPASALAGDAVVLAVTAVRGDGAGARAAEARVTVPLAVSPPPVVAIVGPPILAVGAAGTYEAVATGAGPLRFAWSVSGPGVVATPTQASTGYASATDGTATISLAVTDATGRTTVTALPVVVGTPFVPSGSITPSCDDAATLLGRAFDAAGAGEPLGATVGPVSFEVSDLAVVDPCGGPDASLRFGDGSVNIAGIISGRGVSGTMDATALCLTGGRLDLPPDWGVTAFTLGTPEPLCLRTGPGVTNQLTGSLAATGFPLLGVSSSGPPPVTTLTFGVGEATVSSTTGLPGGGTLDAEVTVGLTGDGTFTAAIEGRDVSVFGQNLTVAGTVAGSAAGIDTFDVSGSLPGPVTLAPGAVARGLELAWTSEALTAQGTLELGGGLVVLDVSGRLADADNWELVARGRAGTAPFSPLPGLTIDPTGFAGTVKADAGVVTFDVRLDLSGEWTPVPAFTMAGLGAQLSSFPAPGDCPGVDPGEVWFRLDGAASVTAGTRPIAVDASACVGFGQAAWSVGATSTFGSWTPVAGLDVSVQSVGVTVRGVGTDVTIGAHGAVQALGVDLGARVLFRPSDLAIVVDAFGDLSGAGMGLPSGSVGHVVVASADVDDFRFDDPVLAGVVGVRAGLSLYAGFAPDPALGGFLTDTLGLPPISALVVSAELGGADVTLRAAITLGAGGLPLFETCPSGGCTSPDQATSLALTEVALSLSLSGRIALAATARLGLPASPDGATPASELSLTAEIALDLAGPAITLALFTSDGTWNGALGVPGLNLADLAIQGGVNFASPVPVPTVGFGATVVNLPAAWAGPIGMPTDPAQQEPMSFVLNISQTAPILAINVGVADGNTALRPLQAIPGQADTLLVDAAHLVIAPFGGTVGPYVFEPGLSLGFDGVIAGVDVNVAARVGLIPPLLEAELSVGPIPVAGMTIRNVDASLRIDPTGFAASFSGAVDLPAGMPTMAVDYAVSVDPGGIRAAAVGEVRNWEFGPFARLDTFTASMDASLTSLSAPPTATFAAAGSGQVLGTPVTASGSVGFAGASLRTANLQLSAGAFRIGPTGPLGVTVGGRGCDGIAGTADDGACLRLGFDSRRAQPFTGSLSGQVTTAGLTATIDGSMDERGVAVSGELDARGFGRVAMAGRLYSGTLTGVTDTRPDGSAVSVRTGDWKLTATAERTGTLAGFSFTGSAQAGSLGGTTFVDVGGTLEVGSTAVAARTALSFSGGTLRFDVDASVANLQLGAVRIDSARVRLSDTAGLRAEGNVSIGVIGTVRVAGGFTAPTRSNPMQWDLQIDTNFSLLGVSTAATVRVSSTQGFRASVAFSSSAITFNFTGSVTPRSRRVCVSGNVTLQVPGRNPGGHVKWCNRNPSAGFRVEASLFGYTVGPVVITLPTFSFSKRFGPYGGDNSLCFPFPEACLGLETKFDVTAGVSTAAGFSAVGAGSAIAYGETWVLEDWTWRWRRTTLAGVALTIDTERRVACGTVSFVGLTARLCA